MFHFHELMQHFGYTAYGEEVSIERLTSPELSDRQSLILIMDKRHLKNKDSIASRAWIIAQELASEPLIQWLKENHISYAISSHPKKDLIRLIGLFYPEKPHQPLIHPTAVIGSNTRIGKNVCIEAYVVIGDDCSIGDHSRIGAHTVIGSDVVIGNHSVLYPRVSIYSHTIIGHRVIIHSGTVIGSDGFGYIFEEGQWIKIPHAGGVIIEDDVEIGALCAVDRGTLGNTCIGRGCKLDNLIQIAHNVHIGEHTLIAAQAGIAGSTTIGKHVTIAGQAGLVGHITIGDEAVIGAQAGVIGSVPAGQTVSGYPAREHHQALRREALIGKIPELKERISRLEQEFLSKPPDTENR